MNIMFKLLTTTMNESSISETLVPWKFRSLKPSLTGTFVPEIESNMELRSLMCQNKTLFKLILFSSLLLVTYSSK